MPVDEQRQSYTKQKPVLPQTRVRLCDTSRQQRPEGHRDLPLVVPSTRDPLHPKVRESKQTVIPVL